MLILSHSSKGKRKEIKIYINISHMHNQGIPQFRLKLLDLSKVQRASLDHNLLLSPYFSAEHLFYHIAMTKNIRNRTP